MAFFTPSNLMPIWLTGRMEEVANSLHRTSWVREALLKKKCFLSGIARKGGGRTLPEFFDPFLASQDALEVIVAVSE